MKHRIAIDKTVPNTGALDFSDLLDAPAGTHGFVQSRDGHLYFEDGKRARFLGFNLAARSNTPDHATAEKIAARLASLGVNVVRLHAADAPIGDEPGSWSSCREAPLLDYESGTTRRFHPVGLDRFDYFAAQLKSRGIYLHIDLLVARVFLPGDGVDAPMASCAKRYAMYNEKLIALQKEYAKALLTHVNPYTGLALIDDPAVMTVQINNEESAIKGTDPENHPFYENEVRQKFNRFLLEKYGGREALEKAWTCGTACALGADEDPAQGTVRGIDGSFYQPVSEPSGDWGDTPRYADFMEFGIRQNRTFYQEMKAYLQGLGVKVPIVASNLVAGAADVYGHTDGDLMENNSYFNHPLLPLTEADTYLVTGPMEYVSTNPLTVQRGAGAMGTTLVSFGAIATVAGKPFALSEWNEYGEHPFHSTAFLHTVAYACLNDWDALILYNHHTSENSDDQPADEIRNIFDVYNDPAVICQWGHLAAVFLKGLISPAKRRVDVVYTQEDLLTLPNFHAMPMCFFPYITGMRNVFLEQGETYGGGADVAVNAGFLNGADLFKAKHGVYYAWSEYRDAFRRYPEKNRLARAKQHPNALVLDDICALAGSGDYCAFAETVDRAMKCWGVLDAGTGYVDGKLISDTGEIVFDPEHARFSVRAPRFGYFSGAPEEETALSENVTVEAKNGRITLALLPRGDGEALLTALGTTGMDETTFDPGPAMMGVPFTAVHMRGKLFAETLEGAVRVRAKSASLVALDVYGNEIARIPGERRGDETVFPLDGSVPAVHFLLRTEA